MPCLFPISAYQAPSGGPLVFNHHFNNIAVRCGRCMDCRLERSRQWALRCEFESRYHSANSFVTLTYDDDHMPEFHTLVPNDLRDFMKRLRSRLDCKIRFFACGEYGTVCKGCGLSKKLCQCLIFREGLGRPHYHLNIFGYDFPDRKLSGSRGDYEYYESELISDTWPFGLHVVTDFSIDTAGYTARYITKKITGDLADEHYAVVDHDGVVFQRVPEFVRMSRRPGIGRDWFDQYSSTDLEKDFIVVRGRKMRPPKYFDRLIADDDVFKSVIVKNGRKQKALERKDDNVPERLAVKGEILRRRLIKLSRGYDNETV